MYHHLNTLTIFPDKLAHNLDILSRLQGNIQAVPVLKSNAYGHGIKILAPLLASYDVPFVCVDSLYEAYELEKHGYKKDILIMGYADPRDISRRKNFIYAISDLEYASALIGHFSRVRIHLFLDTGMHREGMPEIDSVFAKNTLAKIHPHIEGIMSHLSTPDDTTVTNLQLSRFQFFQNELKNQGITPNYIHIFASGGIIHASGYNTSLGNVARTGLAFYGYGHPDLLPALRFTTRLIQKKVIQKWEEIGYDGTYCAENMMKIGILPIGYNDGVDRRLSSTWVVSLHGTLCPIVGRVSMNLTTIDITHCDAWVGDEVVVIDENPASPISLLRQSERAQMIPYDMLVHLNKEMYRTTIKKK